jgi:hypothetical protein
VVAWAIVFLTPLVLAVAAASLAGSAGVQTVLGLAGAAVGVLLARLAVQWLGFRGEAR